MDTEELPISMTVNEIRRALKLIGKDDVANHIEIVDFKYPDMSLDRAENLLSGMDLIAFRYRWRNRAYRVSDLMSDYDLRRFADTPKAFASARQLLDKAGFFTQAIYSDNGGVEGILAIHLQDYRYQSPESPREVIREYAFFAQDLDYVAEWCGSNPEIYTRGERQA